MTEHHGYLDRFSINSGFVIAEGWANNADPRVLYESMELDGIWKRVVRPDVWAVFGEDSASWGFRLCAVLPDGNLDHSLFSIRFSNGLSLANPCATFNSAGDIRFNDMRTSFMADVSRDGGRMLEIGSRDRSGSSYRSWFPGIDEFVGLDVTAGPGVDVVGDAHHMSRCLSGKFDFAFSIAVFEHLLMPWKVALELNSVLKMGGRALIISHAGWPLHEEPWDFFRFSKESWSGLFNVHTGFRLVDSQYQYPARIVPDYAADPHMAVMSQGLTYLLSGCVVEKVGEPQVEWSAEASEVYNLGYSHA